MKKIIPASYHRNEYDKATFEDAIVYTVTLQAATATKVTNAYTTTITLNANFTPTSTELNFTGLAGNLPWSSYSKFSITNPRTTSPSIPSSSLPNPGALYLYDTSTLEAETVYYGSISWTSQTAGLIHNIKRGATPTTFLAASPSYGYLMNGVPVREKVLIWNNSGGIVYMGYDGSINATPTNAVEIPDAAEHGLWLEPLVDIWLYSTNGGTVNIAEYR